MLRRFGIIGLLFAFLMPGSMVFSAEPSEVPDPPTWAVQYTEGLKAWREIIGYWIEQQNSWGSFGFGAGEDCEMTVGWPGVMMATDDRQIELALERMSDGVWNLGVIQNGYIAIATDPEHGAEPTSYTNPVLLYQKFGSPKLIERLMVTAQNVETWTGRTPKGDRHMRSTYYGSQQAHEWLFYSEDSPINARAWLPMMHLVMYNRDPYLKKYFLEWTASWAKHAMADCYGKPPGILPGTVAFKTGKPGEFTKNWWGAGAHDFSSLWYQTRLHGMLVVAYTLTGDEKYITPLREMLRFFSTYAKPAVAKGQPLPPDRLPKRYTFPEGWRDGDVSTRWARDVAMGHPGGWYYYVTGDMQFDAAFSKLLGREIKRGAFTAIDKEIVERGARRATSSRDSYFTDVLERVKQGGSTANYAAAWWQKRYGTMTFGPRCFHDGGRLANSVNWPWVDFPMPSVVWKNTGYTTGIFVLDDSSQRFAVALANLADRTRSIGAQLFTLDEGDYQLRLGPDVDGDGEFDAVTRTDRVFVERGTIVPVDLPRHVTMLLELTRAPDAGPVPEWRSRPDLGLDPWDVMISKENASPGDEVTVTVRVHNIGTAPAGNVRVTVSKIPSNEFIPIAEGTVKRIDPPAKLRPSFLDVMLKLTCPADTDSLLVSIDPLDVIDELYEGNNRVSVDICDLKTSQPVKKIVQHEPVKRASLADVDPDKCSRYDAPFGAGIKVDGLIGEAGWADVPVFELLPNPKTRLEKRTWMQAAYDDEALYLALRCEEPDPDRLDTDLPNTGKIYYNDGFEIFIDPGCDVWRYWQFVFDTALHKLQIMTRNQYARKVPWDVAVHVGEREWTAELRFPLDAFVSWGIEPPKPGSRWRMNVNRFTTTLRDPAEPDRRRSERSHFSPKGRLQSHHEPKLWGDVYFKQR